MSGSSSLLCVLLIVACTSFVVGLSPTFLWSNTDGSASSQVSYEVVQGSDVILSTVLAASSNDAAGAADKRTIQPAEFVLAYFGKQADSAFFRRTGSPAGPLQSSLESSSSWMVYQYTSFQEDDSYAEVAARLAKDNVEFQSIGCDQGSSPEDAVDATKGFLEVEGGPRVLLVCSNAADAVAEVTEVLSLQTLMATSGKRYVLLYATAAEAGATQRKLTETQPLVCDALCKSQVAWLQGILAAGVLLIALLSGLSCTYLLEGPSKFEVPKDSTVSS